MLRIYEKDLTAASLSTALATNGLGALPHTLSCTRHQVINGDWSLTLSYPLDAPGAALLQPERLLCYEDEGGAQLYRISRLKPSISRQGRTLEVEAPHLCYDLAHKYIVNIETSEDDRYPDGIDAATALEQLLAGTGLFPRRCDRGRGYAGLPGHPAKGRHELHQGAASGKVGRGAGI